MKRRKKLIVAFVTVLFFAMIVFVCQLNVQKNENLKQEQLYIETFEETKLMFSALYEVTSMRTSQISYEEYVEFAHEHDAIIELLLNDGIYNKRIPTEALERYNKIVSNIFGEYSAAYLIDEQKDRDLQGWVDGLLFYRIDLSINYNYWYNDDIRITSLVYSDEYEEYLKRVKDFYEDMSHDKAVDLIEYASELMTQLKTLAGT